MNRLKQEIGSHFEMMASNGKPVNEVWPWEDQLADKTYPYTGRAAIELAILDIKASRPCSTVYMPSYCCQSMVWAFEKHNFNIEYYTVSHNGESLEFDIDFNKNCDLFFAMSYFGIASETIDDAITAFSKRGVLVLEDITHRLLSRPCRSEDSDYWVASLRKWFPIASGGFLGKKKDKLTNRADIIITQPAELKFQAMEMKMNYLAGQPIDKPNFLNLFYQADLGLYDLDSRTLMDQRSFHLLELISINQTIEKRRNNARMLATGVQKLKWIKPLLKPLDLESDTPLFYPVLVGGDLRNHLRSYLQAKDVYCPVHWPKRNEMPSGIEENELSLICDQRYGWREMERIIDLLTEWENSLLEKDHETS